MNLRSIKSWLLNIDSAWKELGGVIAIFTGGFFTGSAYKSNELTQKQGAELLKKDEQIINNLRDYQAKELDANIKIIKLTSDNERLKKELEESRRASK